MRITNLQLNRNYLNNLNQTLSRLERIQREIATGKTITRPEDDPAKVVEVLQFSSNIADVDQFVRNAERSEDFLVASEAALNTLTNTLQRARELAVQGANGVLGTGDLSSVRSEVVQLIEEALATSNTKFGDQYLFAGTKTTTQPHTLDSATYTATYAGNSNAVQTEIDRGHIMTINTPGDTAFPQVFSALKDLIDYLGAGDSGMVGSVSLLAIDGSLDTVLETRAQIGARIQRVRAVASRLEDLNVRQRALLSKLQELDFAEGVTELAMAETAFRASLAVGGRILQPSLLDFLR